MINNEQNLKRFLLVCGDLLVFQAALVVTLTIRHGGWSLTYWQQNAGPFFLLSLIWILVFYIAGLYDLVIHRDSLKLFRVYLEGMIANLAIALGFFYLLPIFGIEPRTILALQFAVALLLGYFWRLGYSKWIVPRFSSSSMFYIGPAEDIQQVDTLLRASSLGYELRYALATSGETCPHETVRWVADARHLADVLKKEPINIVVVGVKPESVPGLKEALYSTLFSSTTIIDRAELEEATTGRIPLSYVSETWFLQHLREGEKAWYETAKRAVDILLAIPFGVLTLLLFPFVTILMKLTMPGPIFYSQTRVGKNGKHFRIWKFRTMLVDSEKNGAQFTPSASSDPRLTWLGKMMRQYRIDELPQIWNVLRGDISLVGPRPERPEFVEPLVERVPYYSLRHLTRPGLTGWAQVTFLTPIASLEDNLKKLQYDLYYIKHRSPLLDFIILLRTIGIILRRQGT